LKPKKWRSQWWILIAGVVIIVISFFTPQVIDWLYLKQKSWSLATTFTKEEMLSFYGAFLGFIGTISLGVLALWQNINMHNITIKQETLKNRAYFALVSVADPEKYIIKQTNDKRDEENVYIFNGDILNLDTLSWFTKGDVYYGLIRQQILTSVVLKNVGGNFAHHIMLTFIVNDIKVPCNKVSATAVGEEIAFYPLYTDLAKLRDKTLQLSIEFRDMCNNDYVQNIEVVIFDNRLAFNTNSSPIMVQGKTVSAKS
jgi:hypothetical protein